MAVDIFLKLTDVKGEAMDRAHKDEIDVLAWSWGASQSGTTHAGGGGGSGKASFQDLSITKYVDASSNSLLRCVATGDHIKEALLTVRKAGKKPLEYIKLLMKECLITSLSTGGSGGEDRLTENITINFAKFEYTYVTQKTDGSAGTNMPFNFSIEENAEY
jgi:type VI secretion system secreted protein Hcp